MKKKNIIIIIIVAVVLAGIITAAVTLYNNLSAQMITENVVEFRPTENTEEAGSSKPDDSAQNESEDVDHTAPDFTFYDYEGNEYKISDFKGQPVVLNFWASWCPPCRSEMPYFDEAYSEYQGSVVFLMVNLTDKSQETVLTAKNFYEEQGYSFPLYFDTSGAGARNYNIYYIPDTFFITKSGELYSYATGAISEETLTENILAILE